MSIHELRVFVVCCDGEGCPESARFDAQFHPGDRVPVEGWTAERDERRTRTYCPACSAERPTTEGNER